MPEAKSKPQSRLFKIKTNPAVHAVVHTSRRLHGRRDLAQLPAGRTDSERAVRRALHEALHTNPNTAATARIERVRADYLASDTVLMPDSEWMTRTLAGAATVSRSPRSAWLLYQVVKHLEPSFVVETGSCVGISAAYQAAALPSAGRLVTLELCPELVEQTRRTFVSAGVDDRASVVAGDIADTLPGVVADAERIDVAFVDGGHDSASVRRETDLLLSRAVDGTVVSFDDIDWSADMKQAWEQVCRNPRFRECIDFGASGLAVVGPPSLEQRVLRVHYA